MPISYYLPGKKTVDKLSVQITLKYTLLLRTIVLSFEVLLSKSKPEASSEISSHSVVTWISHIAMWTCYIKVMHWGFSSHNSRFKLQFFRFSPFFAAFSTLQSSSGQKQTEASGSSFPRPFSWRKISNLTSQMLHAMLQELLWSNQDTKWFIFQVHLALLVLSLNLLKFPLTVRIQIPDMYVNNGTIGITDLQVI